MHMWHHKQNDNSSCNGISRNPTDGSWLSSPHSSGPSHLCHDTTDTSKSVTVSAWPILKTHSEILNKNDNLIDQVDKENKIETARGCRVFGSYLNDPCTNSPNASGVTSERCVVTPLSRTDADQTKFDISKTSKERKQEQSPNETLSKQINSRSCTKVHGIRYLSPERFMDLWPTLNCFLCSKGSNAGCCSGSCGVLDCIGWI